VLYGACACSDRVLEHLATRGVMASTSEHVVLAGTGRGDRAGLLRARGFSVDSIAPEQLKTRYGLEVAPLLIVAAPDGSIRYLGGYTERKQGPRIRDRETLHELQSGRATSLLPLFGCAVSRQLQQLFDPFRLKYLRKAS
jgi:hypothetical protein